MSIVTPVFCQYSFTVVFAPTCNYRHEYCVWFTFVFTSTCNYQYNYCVFVGF
jgi:hypothetical protein